MQRILLLLSFIFMNTVLNAQRHSLGIRAGATNNDYSADLSGRLYEKPDRHWGSYLNLTYRYNINNKFSLENGISFLEKNYGSHRTGVYQGIYSKTNNSFVENAWKIIFRIYDLHQFNFKISGGLYGEYWISSKISGALPNILNSQTGNTNQQGEQLFSLTRYNGRVPFHSFRDNRFQFGGVGGFEIGWKLSKSLQAILNNDFYRTITRHEKRSWSTKKGQRDSGFLTSAGVIWFLSHHSK